MLEAFEEVMEEQQPAVLWSGRFREPLDSFALTFSTSIHEDKRLYRHDVNGSIAHAKTLLDAQILTQEEFSQIKAGLLSVLEEIESGVFLPDAFEDIHSAIEHRLTEKIGVLGGKLHTGRSRNDQIALDERLYLREKITVLCAVIAGLQKQLVKQAEQNIAVIMPGFTHVQHAQPILLSHHLLAYVNMLERDKQRLLDAQSRLNYSPLGAAAFAGTSYPLDRTIAVKELGFAGIVTNSIDAVSDRDYIIEVVSACSIVMMHLSRMAEEIVLWSSKEFDFITLSDRVTTGSSIMPNKKNPDLAELVRGKVGRVYGSLINILTTMKALPLSYNRDMQEDKLPMFEALDTTEQCIKIMELIFKNCEFNKERLQSLTEDDLLLATEIADYLVRQGVPFREAHHITGEVVQYAVEHNMSFKEIPDEELFQISPALSKIFLYTLDAQKSIELKSTAGSTSRKEVKAQLEAWKERLAG